MFLEGQRALFRIPANDHAIAWDSAVVVDRESGTTSRKIKEVLHIVMEKAKGPLMNKDEVKVSDLWKGLI